MTPRERAQYLVNQHGTGVLLTGRLTAAFEEHERELAQVREERDTYDRALHSLTAGGSEFAHDAKACVAYVRRVHHEQHETIKRFKAERDAERDRATRLEADLGKLQAAYDSVQSGHGWCKCHDALLPVLEARARLEARVEELEGIEAAHAFCHLAGPSDPTGVRRGAIQNALDTALARVARLEGVLRRVRDAMVHLRAFVYPPEQLPDGARVPRNVAYDESAQAEVEAHNALSAPATPVVARCTNLEPEYYDDGTPSRTLTECGEPLPCSRHPSVVAARKGEGSR